MSVSLTIEVESIDQLIAELEAALRSLPRSDDGALPAPTAVPQSGETREELMERKVSTLWSRTGERVQRVATAIAELQEQGKDTSAPALTAHLGGSEKESSVRALMAILRRSLDKIDRSPGEPPMLIESTAPGGHARYRFALEACAAINRRRALA
jgi:hypothetical protein